MGQEERADAAPHLGPVSRRHFLKLLAAGAGAAAFGAAGVSLISWAQRAGSLQPEDIPVRNPAFREARGEREGHVVLYCRSGEGDCLAYDLNSSAYSIWRDCCAHDAHDGSSPRTLAQIAAQAGGRLDIETVRSFAALLHSKGLIYFGPRSNQAYFVYEGLH